MPRDSFDPRSISDELADSLRGKSFRNIDDAQRYLDKQVRAYNARPQAELAGLSPLQVQELVSGDWKTTGAFIVNDKVDPAAVGDPTLLHNARLFLTALRDEGPAKATATGNLSRQFVGSLLDRLRFVRDGDLDDIRRMNKVINEMDVPPLETLRYVLQTARLIHRRKGFHITPMGKALLDDSRRGELLALLFRTFFRDLDLRNLDRLDGDVMLQHTVAATFYKIRSEAEDWTTVAHLVRAAWLDSAKDTDARLSYGNFDYRESRFWVRVLEPLVEFGLLEARELRPEKHWPPASDVRKTPLFDRFLLFSLRS